jgi:hypothetical protein
MTDNKEKRLKSFSDQIKTDVYDLDELHNWLGSRKSVHCKPPDRMKENVADVHDLDEFLNWLRSRK